VPHDGSESNELSRGDKQCRNIPIQDCLLCCQDREFRRERPSAIYPYKQYTAQSGIGKAGRSRVVLLRARCGGDRVDRVGPN